MFSLTRTEYGDLLHKSSYSLQIRENTDQKKLRILHFSHSHRKIIYQVFPNESYYKIMKNTLWLRFPNGKRLSETVVILVMLISSFHKFKQLVDSSKTRYYLV